MTKKISAIILKLLLIVILFLGSIMIVFAGITGGAILEVMKTAPEIDADAIKFEMSQTRLSLMKTATKLMQLLQANIEKLFPMIKYQTI